MWRPGQPAARTSSWPHDVAVAGGSAKRTIRTCVATASPGLTTRTASPSAPGPAYGELEVATRHLAPLDDAVGRCRSRPRRATDWSTKVGSVHVKSCPFHRMVQPPAARTLRTQSVPRPQGRPMTNVVSVGSDGDRRRVGLAARASGVAQHGPHRQDPVTGQPDGDLVELLRACGRACHPSTILARARRGGRYVAPPDDVCRPGRASSTQPRCPRTDACPLSRLRAMVPRAAAPAHLRRHRRDPAAHHRPQPAQGTCVGARAPRLRARPGADARSSGVPVPRPGQCIVDGMAGPPAAAKQFNKVAVRLAGHRILPVWAVLRHDRSHERHGLRDTDRRAAHCARRSSSACPGGGAPTGCATCAPPAAARSGGRATTSRAPSRPSSTGPWRSGRRAGSRVGTSRSMTCRAAISSSPGPRPPSTRRCSRAGDRRRPS